MFFQCIESYALPKILIYYFNFSENNIKLKD